MFGFKSQDYEKILIVENILAYDHIFHYYFLCTLNKLNINIVEKNLDLYFLRTITRSYLVLML